MLQISLLAPRLVWKAIYPKYGNYKNTLQLNLYLAVLTVR